MIYKDFVFKNMFDYTKEDELRELEEEENEQVGERGRGEMGEVGDLSFSLKVHVVFFSETCGLSSSFNGSF